MSNSKICSFCRRPVPHNESPTCHCTSYCPPGDDTWRADGIGPGKMIFDGGVVRYFEDFPGPGVGNAFSLDPGLVVVNEYSASSVPAWDGASMGGSAHSASPNNVHWMQRSDHDMDMCYDIPSMIAIRTSHQAGSRAHRDRLTYACDECNANFMRRASFDRHRRSCMANVSMGLEMTRQRAGQGTSLRCTPTAGFYRVAEGWE
ncbi:hypothetical protein FA95DRAFT_66689 [Auriscalpium vulgare]|uniref:Uncharacterized protein n=1 Tax=Auriscalpium vulgare TaxID=40419 RepID=A0ACB8S6S8_9AGAM|nr:hypothetical protein FA95DRAFT_66689 [Auriscalpium vulgare]